MQSRSSKVAVGLAVLGLGIGGAPALGAQAALIVGLALPITPAGR